MKKTLIITSCCLFFWSIATAEKDALTQLLEKARLAIEQTKADEAIAFLHQAEKLSPESGEVHIQLASMYYYTRQPDKSRSYFEKYLSKHPHDAVSYFNLASVYNQLGLFEKSGAILKILCTLSKDERLVARLFKHHLRLQQFDAAEKLRPFTYWCYNENIYGKSILLDCDRAGNGFGDTIQFIRYARYLHQAGAQVTVIAQEALMPLLKLCPYIASVITKKDPIPQVDLTYPICIASLMMFENRRVASPRDIPYLSADQNLIAHWKSVLAHDTQYKIGICCECSVSLNSFTKKIIPNQRSISLDALAPLQSIPGVTFYSLQKKMIFPASWEIQIFDDDFDESRGRFMDTAALMKNLDLVITVDTSIAHLAGALGVPTWLLLTCESDYRWFTDISHSSYYPTMRIFRQPSYGDWQSVVDRLVKQLRITTLAES